MTHKIKISKLRLLSKTSGSLKATANILIDEAIEIIGFTVVHNLMYEQPIVNIPAIKKNEKYHKTIIIHDPELLKEINELILTKYHEKTKTKK